MRKRSRGGYTLAEALTVVALIAILSAIAIPSVIRYRRDLKLTEFDDNARTIYLAAQNRLSALRSASGGTLATGDAAGRPAAAVPAAAVPDLDSGTTLQYVSTDVSGAGPGWLVLPGSVDSGLTEAGSCYLVEFDPASGVIYGVFYTDTSEGKALTQSVYQDIYSFSSGGKSCRTRDGREAFASAEGGFLMGYYGADGALDLERPESRKLPKPKLKLINAEELALEFYGAAADGLDASRVFWSVGITGAGADGGERAVTLVEKGKFNPDAWNTAVLDTLMSSSESGYSKVSGTPAYGGWTVGASFTDWVGTDTIVPGGDITITVTLWYQPDSGEGIAALPQSASWTTNSLFAARSEETAQVAYGRHLQNLNLNTSKVGSGVTAAVQVRDIDFQTTGDAKRYHWKSVYGDRKFTAINNTNLTRYDGQELIIRNLNATAMPYAGLFSSVSGATLENIVLCDASVNGMGSAGALAGTAKNTTVTNCQVYLTAPYTTAARIQSNGTAAGLIGLVTGNVTIDGSYASTVVSGGTVGGLVGRGTGVTVKNSYAASYLSGNQVGGLVGGLENTTAMATIQNCYAAGTIASATSEAAGLLVPHNGTTEEYDQITVENAYAAVDYISVPASDKVYGAVPVGSCANVSYLVKQGVNNAVTVAGVTPVNDSKRMTTCAELGLGAPFIDGGNSSVKARPYNLPNQADGTRPEEDRLTAPYPYPTLRLGTGTDRVAVPHYGDWLVAEAPGALLAYYEIDASGGLTFALYDGGAERGNLDSGAGALLEDGYAYLSRTRLADDSTMWLALGDEGSFTQRSVTYLGALNEDCTALVDGSSEGAVYFVYELPWLDGEVAGLGGGFYLRVRAASDEAGQNDMADGWVNPHFAREAHNNVAKPVKTDSVHIRSVRHLNNIRRYGKLDYIQERDIDGGSYRGGQGHDESNWSLTVAGMKALGKDWEGNWTSDIWDVGAEHRLAFTSLYTTGEEGELSPLNGTYDGGGYTIRNLVIGSYAHTDGATNAGLFFRQNEGSLKNVVLADCRVNGTSGKDADSSGILVGRSVGRIENCVARNCELIVTGSSAKGEAGGLVGYVEKSCVIDGCAVERCTIDGGGSSFDDTTGVYNAGGLAGFVSGLSGSITNCSVTDTTVTNGYVYKSTTSSVEKWGSVGGFIGVWKSGDGAVRNCVVRNTSLTGNQRVGGFIGTLSAGSSAALEECEAVNVAVTGKYESSSKGVLYTNGAGGFAGVVDAGALRACGARLDKDASTLAINTLYNQQCVTAQRDAGGFAGNLTGGQVTNCYAAVKVTGQNAGGFAGEMTAGAVSNSYAGGHTQSAKYAASLPNVTATAQAGGFVGLWNGGTVEGCYTTCAVTGPNDNAADVFANVGADGISAGVAPTGCYAVGAAFVDSKNRGSLTETTAATAMTELDETARTETTAYDTSLAERYPYQPVRDAAGNPLRHYGDWPGKKKSGANREWVQQIAEPESGAAYDNFTAAVEWTGETLNLTFDVHALAGEQNAANTGPNQNGFYAVTTDLGYTLIFRIVCNGDGTYEIKGIDGATWTVTETAELNSEDRHIVLNFTIPTDQIPPYKESISISAMDAGDYVTQQPEKYILTGITNSDPSYHGVEAKALDATIAIDGDFSDWEGYEHQLMESYPAGEQTPLGGHWTASILGYENKIYVHMVNADANDLTDPYGLLNFTVKAQDREGNEINTGGVYHYLLTQKSFPTPGMEDVEYVVTQEVWTEEETGWVQNTYSTYHIYYTAKNDRLEYELEIDLDEWAKIVGVESGDVFGDIQLYYGDYVRVLEVKRDPAT